MTVDVNGCLDGSVSQPLCDFAKIHFICYQITGYTVSQIMYTNNGKIISFKQGSEPFC